MSNMDDQEENKDKENQSTSGNNGSRTGNSSKPLSLTKLHKFLRDNTSSARDRKPTPHPKNRKVKPNVSSDHISSQEPSEPSTDLPKSASLETIERQGCLVDNPNNNTSSHGLNSTGNPSLDITNITSDDKIISFKLKDVVRISPIRVSELHHRNSGVTSNCDTVWQLGSTESIEKICRICHDSPSTEKLIKPCLCKGSMGTVHRSCLERWLGESGKAACEICGQEYNTVRVPKYRGIRSVVAWIRNPLTPQDSRNFFFDLACFFIFTPLACLSAWLCVVGAQNYSFDPKPGVHKEMQLKNRGSLEERVTRDASNSTWTAIGLLSLTGTLVAAYYIWVFVAIRYHLQVWREWQQRNYIVTIVPLANGEFCFSTAQPEERRTSDPPERRPSNNNEPIVQTLGIFQNSPHTILSHEDLENDNSPAATHPTTEQTSIMQTNQKYDCHIVNLDDETVGQIPEVRPESGCNESATTIVIDNEHVKEVHDPLKAKD